MKVACVYCEKTICISFFSPRGHGSAYVMRNSEKDFPKGWGIALTSGSVSMPKNGIFHDYGAKILVFACPECLDKKGKMYGVSEFVV